MVVLSLRHLPSRSGKPEAGEALAEAEIATVGETRGETIAGKVIGPRPSRHLWAIADSIVGMLVTLVKLTGQTLQPHVEFRSASPTYAARSTHPQLFFFRLEPKVRVPAWKYEILCLISIVDHLNAGRDMP